MSLLDKATFPRAPLRSCTVGFPEYSSDLGFPPEAFPARVKLKCWLTSTPPRAGLPPGSTHLRGSACPGSVSRGHPGPPSAQSLFAHSGHYPLRSGVLRHLEGSYPFFFAHTGSCARPKPSHRLQLLPNTVGLCRLSHSPCWELAVPDVISTSLSLDAWTCTTVVLRGAHARFFPRNIGFPRET